MLLLYKEYILLSLLWQAVGAEGAEGEGCKEKIIVSTILSLIASRAY